MSDTEEKNLTPHREISGACIYEPRITYLSKKNCFVSFEKCIFKSGIFSFDGKTVDMDEEENYSPIYLFSECIFKDATIQLITSKSYFIFEHSIFKDCVIIAPGITTEGILENKYSMDIPTWETVQVQPKVVFNDSTLLGTKVNRPPKKKGMKINKKRQPLPPTPPEGIFESEEYERVEFIMCKFSGDQIDDTPRIKLTFKDLAVKTNSNLFVNA